MGTARQFWTPADEQYLRDHYANTSLRHLAEYFTRTTVAIRSRATRLRIKRGGRQFWTVEEERYLRDRYADTSTKAIAQHLCRAIHKVYKKAKRLGLGKPLEYLTDPANRCRLPKGSNIGAAYRFPGGHVPANKGLRRPGWSSGRMKETQFKKGQRTGVAAKNWVPIGTILPDADGYLRVKVRELVHGKEASGWGNSKVWPQLHRRVWEEANGPIPPKNIVVFKDGDKNNCAIENLECITLAENCRRNSMWNIYPRELAEAIQLTGVLKRRLRKANAAK